jgi:hypothetical protein
MLPLPSRTHPQKQNLVVYTEELTHLGPLLNNMTFPVKERSFLFFVLVQLLKK